MIWTYNGQDVKIMFYQSSSDAGALPEDDDKTWDDDGDVFAVATGASHNTSKEINGKYGINHQTPQLLKEGQITYEWSVDNLYTTDEYGGKNLLELINGGETFALKLAFLGSDGTTEDTVVELAYCKADQDNLEGSEDGDVTCNLSGQATERTIS